MSFVLIVSGHPAAGKTTFAARLGDDLGVPVVHRDRLRSYVFGELLELPAARNLLLSAVDRLVLGTLATILDGGGGVVLDGNFNSERHMRSIRGFLAERSTVATEVCLWGDADVLRSRFIDRADPPLTAELEPYFETVVARPHDSVLGSPHHIDHLDTTDLTTIDREYERIREGLVNAIKPGSRTSD